MLIPLPTYTLLHVVLSVLGILAGSVVVGGLISGRQLGGWTGLFLTTTVLTNVTGFGFPFHFLLPSHIVDALSLVILPLGIFALYGKHLAGSWRRVFVITSVTALYFNVFVLLVQLFQKFPLLIAVAPTQQAPAFVGTQLLVLVLFLGLGRAAARGFRADGAVPAH